MTIATMTWANAALRGLLIVPYFVVATVWLPDRMLALGFVADADKPMRDLILLVVWGGTLVGGLYLLRTPQRKETI